MINQTSVRVRYQETDQMGVVYHSNYFVWFEIGRTEFFREIGLEYRMLEEENILVPVVDVNCSYKSPATYDDQLVIRTRASEVKAVKIKFEYEIFRKRDEKLLATGRTVHAFTDRDLKIINFKKNHREIFENILSKVEKNL